LAHCLGLSDQIVHDAILPTHVAPAFLAFKRAKIEGREWAPEFPLKHALKDVRLALDAAREAGIVLHQLGASEELYAQAASQGWGDSDISSVHEVASRCRRQPAGPGPSSEPKPIDVSVIHEISSRG
jgi:3-hydroxyisobutyrate dehydrogenase-like beta-hydroxyacid dehydrogenase